MSEARHCHVSVAGSGAVIADRVRPAHTHWSRLRGLLGTAHLGAREGLWLRPCRQVHMFGMRYPVDLAFLDDRLEVVRTVAALPPGTVSPKVAAATSVLEVSAGRLAALGVIPGTRLAITSPNGLAKPEIDLPPILLNVLLALLFGFFASAHFAAGVRTGRWLTIGPIVLQECLLMGFFFTRRRSTDVATEPAAWVAGIVGTFLPMLFRPVDPPGLVALGAPIQVGGLVLVLVAVASLGRSIGVVPAHRGIKTAGMYTLVRHPIYATHLVAYLGYVISYPSPSNVLIGLATVVALNFRAVFEERLLARDPRYVDYLRRVSWRFLPHVY